MALRVIALHAYITINYYPVVNDP